MELTALLGTDDLSNVQFDSSKYIDLFPVIEADPSGSPAPDQGSITIRGVSFPTVLYCVNEYRSYKF